MKKKVTQLFLLLGLAIGMAGFAQAQISSPERIKVPFDFIAGEKALKAGDYLVSYSLANRNILFIRSVDGKNIATVFGIVREFNKFDNKNRFIFQKREGQYFLTEINTPQTRIGVRNSAAKVESARKSKPTDKL